MSNLLFAGNWKMNGVSDWASRVDEIEDAVTGEEGIIVICPPTTLIDRLVNLRDTDKISIGAQTIHHENDGAHTGDVSAPMIADLGADYVIVGHSERRAAYAQTDALIAQKATKAYQAELMPIICLGESEAQYVAGETLDVVTQQLHGSVPIELAKEFGYVIAYEPIWAIGTGKVATPKDIVKVHNHIRAQLNEMGLDDRHVHHHILYGGSVKPNNSAEICAIENVNGVLVGGASLEPASFVGIINAAG